MKSKRKKRHYWTKETCMKEALKYKTRATFKSGSGGAYNCAKNEGWLDELCSHMTVIGNRFKRLVYVYKFEDNHIYVGLTQNLTNRDKRHQSDTESAVYQHMLKTGLSPTLTHSNFMETPLAVQKEKNTVEEYRNAGYAILNKATPGAVGGENIVWNFEKCKSEALKYQRRVDFVRANNSAYNAARRYGWLEKICKHMPKRKRAPLGYWTKEACLKESLKYMTRMEFYNKAPGAYMSALKNKWLNESCTHMRGNGKKPNGYWTIEKCHEESRKYQSKKEFQKNNGSAYAAALKNGCINELYLINNEIK